MRPVKFAFWGAIVMLAIGAFSFLPGLNLRPEEAALPPLIVEASYGAFLGNFPMKFFNKLALIIFGLVGIKNQALLLS